MIHLYFRRGKDREGKVKEVGGRHMEGKEGARERRGRWRGKGSRNKREILKV